MSLLGETQIKINFTGRPAKLITTPEQKVLVFGFFQKSEIIQPSLLVGGHGGGVRHYLVALVQFENGTIQEVSPTIIQFVDDELHQKFLELNQEGEQK